MSLYDFLPPPSTGAPDPKATPVRPALVTPPPSSGPAADGSDTVAVAGAQAAAGAAGAARPAVASSTARPTPSAAPATSGWSGSARLLAPVRRPAPARPGPPRPRPPLGSQSLPVIMQSVEEMLMSGSTTAGMPIFVVDFPRFLDEYDPAEPNDYEKLLRARETKRRRREQMEHERQRELEEKEQERRREQDLHKFAPPPGMYSSVSSSAVDDGLSTSPPRDMSGEEAFIARARHSSSTTSVGSSSMSAYRSYSPPPTSNSHNSTVIEAQTGEEAFMARARLSGPEPTTGEEAYLARGRLLADQTSSNTNTMSTTVSGSGNIGQRLMAKMGWKEGQGLGREEQGIANPLQVKKTSGSQGYIKPNPITSNPPPAPALATAAPAEMPANIRIIPTNVFDNPTKVVLLKNMVGPGEVDDTLQEETAEECSKQLRDQVPGGRVPPEEAVRIFVKFETVEAAMRALVNLNGRFFAKRQVKAEFYEEAKFDQFNLAP